MHKGEVGLFSRRRIKDWKLYTEKLEVADLQVGNRPTKRLHFLNVDQKTLHLVKEAGQYVMSESQRIVDSFYGNLSKDEYLTSIINEYSAINSLKVSLNKYLEQFFSGEIDEQFVQTRVKVGEVHSRINLSANYFIMGHNLIVQYITTILMEKLNKQPDKMI